MQGNWTVCVPLKYFICMPDIQEAKCLESTVQILPPPLGASGGRGQKISIRANFAPCHIFMSVYALASMFKNTLSSNSFQVFSRSGKC